jgi:cell division protein FtsI/penicillin-binding protein 2
MFKSKTVCKNRICHITAVVVLIFILLIGRLYYLQRKFNPEINSSTEYHTIQNEIISDRNYLLLDSKGRDLLSYKKNYIIVIDAKPFKLNNAEQNLESLIALNFIMKTEYSNFSFDEIMKQANINGTDKFYYNVSEVTYNKIQQLNNVKGIYSYIKDETDKKEYWKIENLLVNASNEEGMDEDSLEMKINNYVKDNKIPQEKFTINQNDFYGQGKYDVNDDNINVMVTLDKDLQSRVREILNSEKYKDFPNAAAVIVEAKSGKIKALAQKNESEPNLITGGASVGYEPGSIFKIITEEAAIEYGDESLNDKHTCTGLICKSDKIHGTLTVREAFNLSCNDIFAKLGAKVGEDKLLYLAKKQGLFNTVLGLDSNNSIESSGQLPVKDSGVGLLSIGQSIQVTPLQMVGVVTTVLNNGKYVKPYIVDSLVNQKGDVIKKFNTTYEQVISPSTAKLVKTNMKEVVDKGTGQNAKINGIEIGGKTGTAETIKDGKKDFHGWFIGYVNVDDNYYAIAVFVPFIGDKNENGDNNVGGTTATPIFKDIATELIKK